MFGFADRDVSEPLDEKGSTKSYTSSSILNVSSVRPPIVFWLLAPRTKLTYNMLVKVELVNVVLKASAAGRWGWSYGSSGDEPLDFVAERAPCQPRFLHSLSPNSLPLPSASL